MRIAWVTSAGDLVETEQGLTSSLASCRYRVIIPARELKSRKHDVYVIGILSNEGSEDFARRELVAADVAVFGKNHINLAEVRRLLDHLQQSGITTIVDICDDHFAVDADHSAHYREIVANADEVIASCPYLAGLIEEATRRKAHVVVDPYEGPAGQPKRLPESSRLNALWFGHESNLPSLERELVNLATAAKGFELEVNVLTGRIPDIEAQCAAFSAKYGNSLTVRFTEWSIERTWRALCACDLVLIPVDRRRRGYLAKGANRLIESLWAGRFVVANPIPSYEEFQRWAWIGEDIVAGISWAVAHPAEVLQRIATAQAYIRERFSPGTIASDWENVLRMACERRRAAAR